jgi:nuclear RNA export factor
MLCLRAYGGHEAWVPETPDVPQAIAPPVSTPVPAAPGAAPGDEQAQRAQLIAQMSAKSGMTPQFSEMALSSNNWNPEAAWKNFEQLKVSASISPISFFGHILTT